MGVEAVNQILKKRGIGAEEIDMIIVATVTADYPFPDTANLVALFSPLQQPPNS